MRRITTLAVFLMLTTAALAQVVDPRQRESSQRDEARLQQERFLWEMEQRDSAASRAQQEVVERRATEYQRLEFERRVNKVAAIWNRPFEDYQRGHVLNIKDAGASLEGVSRSGTVPVAQIGYVPRMAMGRCSQKWEVCGNTLWAPHASRRGEFGTSLLGLFTLGTLRTQRIPATPESPR